MGIFGLLISALQNMLSEAWSFFSNGGFLLLVLMLLNIGWILYKRKIVGDFIGSIEWTFLHVKIEKENEQSIQAVDHMFAQFHALHQNFTWAEANLEGKVNRWFSLEIVSIGGKISYIMRIPKNTLHLVQSGIYAHFPNAEITEVKDYMEHLRHWDAQTSNWDLWGTEFLQTKDYPYPIKTYREFEHPAAENPIIDPLAGMLEALNKLEPHELMAVQIVIRPIADKDWTTHSQEVVKELKKEAVHKKTWFQTLFPFIHVFGEKTIFEAIKDAPNAGGHGDENNFPVVQRMSEGEKKILSGVEMKMTKPGWETKVRTLYIAPKNAFDGNKKSAVIGAFRQFSTVTSNNLKPDVQHTWTNHNYKIFKTLEKPFTDWMIEFKKHHFLAGFAERSMWIGANPMIFNTEELATMWHFPLITTATPPVERIDIKKGQPPQNLPVAG